MSRIDSNNEVTYLEEEDLEGEHATLESQEYPFSEEAQIRAKSSGQNSISDYSDDDEKKEKRSSSKSRKDNDDDTVEFGHKFKQMHLAMMIGGGIFLVVSVVGIAYFCRNSNGSLERGIEEVKEARAAVENFQRDNFQNVTRRDDYERRLETELEKVSNLMRILEKLLKDSKTKRESLLSPGSSSFLQVTLTRRGITLANLEFLLNNLRDYKAHLQTELRTVHGAKKLPETEQNQVVRECVEKWQEKEHGPVSDLEDVISKVKEDFSEAMLSIVRRS